MTTIVIQKDGSNAYKGFFCMGHAQYAKKRRNASEGDVLCAGISALVIGTINALSDLAGEKLEVAANEADGFIRCNFEEPLQEKSVFLMDAMVYALEGLCKEYGGQYLQIKFEEV